MSDFQNDNKFDIDMYYHHANLSSFWQEPVEFGSIDNLCCVMFRILQLSQFSFEFILILRLMF
jgi:hypothetical protein